MHSEDLKKMLLVRSVAWAALTYGLAHPSQETHLRDAITRVDEWLRDASTKPAPRSDIEIVLGGL